MSIIGPKGDQWHVRECDSELDCIVLEQVLNTGRGDDDPVIDLHVPLSIALGAELIEAAREIGDAE